jgi:DNA (cytosine-5)-methyltransferase 1
LIPVVDLFAGPGGLNEGFSRLGEDTHTPVFHTIGSFEMESSACQTLRLRGAYRYVVREGVGLDDYYRFLSGEISIEGLRALPAWTRAFAASDAEVNQIELGLDRDVSDALIRKALWSEGLLSDDSTWALIGGPPCQAYSLAGRSRRTNDVTFEDDKKHFLYLEYLHILAEFAPPIFVMENVKGLLSSKHSGERMFDMIRRDLENPRGAVSDPRDSLEYEIHSLTVDSKPDLLEPRDYIIRSEQYGIPQKRHRVILLGVRKGFFPVNVQIGKLIKTAEVTVRDAISLLPQLRSGISPAHGDDPDVWSTIRMDAQHFPGADDPSKLLTPLTSRGKSFISGTQPSGPSSTYSEWVKDPNIKGTIQHETRAHMPEDLKRYYFASETASTKGLSPKLREYPESLLPNHENARSDNMIFEDRFRVQIWDEPATTVVSHISKDGHYYIHPDSSQMRSLTVREAARLQSFPDNYFFMGSRTQQYHQVGNAVPPLLANQIARVVADLLEETSSRSNHASSRLTQVALAGV